MQTFLVHPIFATAVAYLDDKRLGNQRVEARILYDAITIGNGWSNHTAARMWKGYAPALALYYNSCLIEWGVRGHKNAMAGLDVGYGGYHPMPPWLGDKAFHYSHRSNLLKKNPQHYAKFGWDVSHDLPYVWPRNWGRVYEPKDLLTWDK